MHTADAAARTGVQSDESARQAQAAGGKARSSIGERSNSSGGGSGKGWKYENTGSKNGEGSIVGVKIGSKEGVGRAVCSGRKRRGGEGMGRTIGEGAGTRVGQRGERGAQGVTSCEQVCLQQVCTQVGVCGRSDRQMRHKGLGCARVTSGCRTSSSNNRRKSSGEDMNEDGLHLFPCMVRSEKVQWDVCSQEVCVR